MDWGKEVRFQQEAAEAMVSVCSACAFLGGCLLVEDVVLGELLTALEGTRGGARSKAIAVIEQDDTSSAMDVDCAGSDVDVDVGAEAEAASEGDELLEQKRRQVLAVSAYLARHGPSALGWMLTSRWRDDVLIGLSERVPESLAGPGPVHQQVMWIWWIW